MAVCEVCGNDYDKAFEVRAGGATHVFDSFECAKQEGVPELRESRMSGRPSQAGRSGPFTFRLAWSP